MQNDPTPTRRHVVATGAAATLGIAAATTLAACGGSSDGTAAPSATTPAAGGNGSSSAGAGGVLAKVSDVPVGGAINAQSSDGKPIVIAQPQSGTVVAFSASCTHRGCKVTPNGAKLNCACHGSQFDALTGAVLRGPASSALPSVPVTVQGTDVVAG